MIIEIRIANIRATFSTNMMSPPSGVVIIINGGASRNVTTILHLVEVIGKACSKAANLFPPYGLPAYRVHFPKKQLFNTEVGSFLLSRGRSPDSKNGHKMRILSEWLNVDGGREKGNIFRFQKPRQIPAARLRSLTHLLS
jgi:hypothetical protein